MKNKLGDWVGGKIKIPGSQFGKEVSGNVLKKSAGKLIKDMGTEKIAANIAKDKLIGDGINYGESILKRLIKK